MVIVVAVVLTILTLILIVYPLFRRRSSSEGLNENEELQDLDSKRKASYSMLQELEFDFHSGVISKEDYLEERNRRKAISPPKEIDDLKKATELEEEIEKQILEIRRYKGEVCPQCGARCQDDDRFCSGCGANLNKGGRIG